MYHKTLRRYYKRMMYHDRTIAARILDFLAVRTILLFILWLFFTSRLKSSSKGAVLAVIGVLAFSAGMEIVKERRLSRFIEKKQYDLSCSYWLSRLVLADARSFSALVTELLTSMGYRINGTHQGIFFCESSGEASLIFPIQYHETYALSPQDTLDMYHIACGYEITEVLVIATCSLSDEAREFVHRLPGFHFRILNREALLKAADRAGMLPSAAETEAALIRELKAKEMSLRKLKTQALSQSKYKAYLFSGCVLLAASYLTGFHLYYPIIAAVCFLLAAITRYHTRPAPKG